VGSYQIIVTRHPIDGILLCLELGQAVSPILVAPGAVTSTDDYFGLAETTSLDQALTLSKFSSLNSEGRSFRLLWGSEIGAAGLLDRLRRKLADEEQILISLEYDRLETDLPILQENDSVSLFWNAEELLTDRYLDQVEYLEERLSAETPAFSGLHFYHRGDLEPEERLEKLQKKAKLKLEPSKTIEGGYQWAKVCL
jgi:hypothetical protein